MADGKPKRHMLLTTPRTASNLLTKVLNLDGQPSIISHPKRELFFAPTMRWKVGPAQLGSKSVFQWTGEEKDGLRETLKGCADGLVEVLKKADEEGKNVYVKEHVNFMLEPVGESRWAYGEKENAEVPWVVDVDGLSGQTHSEGNVTVFSDEFMNSWSPTFLIRHPALVFPSNYRTLYDLHGAEAARTESYHRIEMTLHWSRTLYDWYAQQKPATSTSPWPIVLEADDIMTNPALVPTYAALIGLDASKLTFQWQPAGEEELEKLGAVGRRMKSTISASGGIVAGKTGEGIDVDVEAGKWKEEFGEVEGAKIERWVRDAMADYEYLKERRLKE